MYLIKNIIKLPTVANYKTTRDNYSRKILFYEFNTVVVMFLMVNVLARGCDYLYR